MQDEHTKLYLELFENLVDAKFHIDQCNYGKAHDTLTYAQYAVGRAFVRVGGTREELERVLEGG